MLLITVRHIPVTIEHINLTWQQLQYIIAKNSEYMSVYIYIHRHNPKQLLHNKGSKVLPPKYKLSLVPRKSNSNEITKA